MAIVFVLTVLSTDFVTINFVNTLSAICHFQCDLRMSYLFMPDHCKEGDARVVLNQQYLNTVFYIRKWLQNGTTNFHCLYRRTTAATINMRLVPQTCRRNARTQWMTRFLCMTVTYNSESSLWCSMSVRSFGDSSKSLYSHLQPGELKLNPHSTSLPYKSC
jgi:hypothetical protein